MIIAITVNIEGYNLAEVEKYPHRNVTNSPELEYFQLCTGSTI
jgi:hypothetical protein